MSISLKLYRELFKEYLKVDAEAQPMTGEDSFRDFQIGTVVFWNPHINAPQSLPLKVIVSGIQTSALVKYVDGERSIALLPGDILDKSPQAVLGVVAHEVGHAVCEHLDHENKSRLSTLSVRTVSLERHLALAVRQDATDQDERRYYRSLMGALMRGGVFIGEYQADLAALRYVSVHDLIAVHACDLGASNWAVRWEKINRINLLRQLKDSDYQPKLELKVEFEYFVDGDRDKTIVQILNRMQKRNLS